MKRSAGKALTFTVSIREPPLRPVPAGLCGCAPLAVPPDAWRTLFAYTLGTLIALQECTALVDSVKISVVCNGKTPHWHHTVTAGGSTDAFSRPRSTLQISKTLARDIAIACSRTIPVATSLA